MNLAFLASFIALILAVAISVKKQAKAYKEREDAFWSRENRANTVRKKDISNLEYIEIPLEKFPTHLCHDREEVVECIGIIESLTSQKILNLTGYSNTDLKLEYGTGNITLLSEYDQNYTVLVRTLQKWADCLIDAGYLEEAATLMEFAVRTGTDISRTYYKLAEYWVSSGKASRVDYLIQTAQTLRSSNRDHIVNTLRSTYPDVF